MNRSVVGTIQHSLLQADVPATITQKKGCLEVEAAFDGVSVGASYRILVYVNAKGLGVSRPYIGKRDKTDGSIGTLVVLFKKAPPNIQRQAMRLHEAVLAAVNRSPEAEQVAAPTI